MQKTTPPENPILTRAKAVLSADDYGTVLRAWNSHGRLGACRAAAIALLPDDKTMCAFHYFMTGWARTGAGANTLSLRLGKTVYAEGSPVHARAVRQAAK